MQPRPALDIDLTAVWPDFLDTLDSDPAQAQQQFSEFLDALLTDRPPGVYRSLEPEERENVGSMTKLHCLEQNCARLRSYGDHQRSFAAWLQKVVHNRAVDHLRAHNLHRARFPSIEQQLERDGAPPFDPEDTYSAQPGDQLLHDEAKSIARTAIGELSRRCRRLLWLSGTGLKPREMLPFLDDPGADNKIVGTDLSYCRKRLRAVLADMGHDPADLISPLS